MHTTHITTCQLFKISEVIELYLTFCCSYKDGTTVSWELHWVNKTYHKYKPYLWRVLRYKCWNIQVWWFTGQNIQALHYLVSLLSYLSLNSFVSNLPLVWSLSSFFSFTAAGWKGFYRFCDVSVSIYHMWNSSRPSPHTVSDQKLGWEWPGNETNLYPHSCHQHHWHCVAICDGDHLWWGQKCSYNRIITTQSGQKLTSLLHLST